MISKRVIGLLVLSVLAVSVSAQSNHFIDALLLEESISFGGAVHLILNSAGLIPEEASVQEAIDVLDSKSWKATIRPSALPIKLGEFAYIVMEALHIPGGLMYSVLPGPRYACRELYYLEIIPDDPDPGRSLTGEEALRILGFALEWREQQA